jgi:hypothetical protein
MLIAGDRDRGKARFERTLDEKRNGFSGKEVGRMKRMVLIAMGLLLLAGSGFAQPFPGLPDTAYVGLFSDVGHTTYSVNYTATPPAFTSFYMYIYWLPGKNGFLGADFRISYPSNVIGGTVTTDQTIAIVMGDLAGGMSFTYKADSCQTNWVYSHRQRIYLTDATQSQIEIIEHPPNPPGVIPFLDVVSCAMDLDPVKRFTYLYLNWNGGTAVESKSWGAIKNLYNK